MSKRQLLNMDLKNFGKRKENKVEVTIEFPGLGWSKTIVILVLIGGGVFFAANIILSTVGLWPKF